MNIGNLACIRLPATRFAIGVFDDGYWEKIYVGIAVESHIDGRRHFEFYKSQQEIAQDKNGR